MKKRTVAYWIKTHKFWSSVIIMFSIGCMLSPTNLFNPLGMGRLIGLYVFFGSIIWSVQAKKKGLTLITLGSILALTAAMLWVVAMVEGFEGVAIGIFAGFFTFLSVLFLLVGIRRCRETGTDR